MTNSNKNRMNRKMWNFEGLISQTTHWERWPIIYYSGAHFVVIILVTFTIPMIRVLLSLTARISNRHNISWCSKNELNVNKGNVLKSFLFWCEGKPKNAHKTSYVSKLFMSSFEVSHCLLGIFYFVTVFKNVMNVIILPDIPMFDIEIFLFYSQSKHFKLSSKLICYYHNACDQMKYKKNAIKTK